MSKKLPSKAANPLKSSTNTLIAHTQSSYEFSGPIPHPSLLNAYDPETRRTIVEMAKEQSIHRHSLELSVIQSNIRNERTGMYLAAFLTFSLIAAGFCLVAIGKDVAGYLSIFGPLVFQAGNYIYNKTKENSVKNNENESENSR
jgi:uncharacterized membrane protein